MTVLQLFPTFARLLAGSDEADFRNEVAANSLPPRLYPVVATPEPESLDDSRDRIGERLDEATQILLKLLDSQEVQIPLFPRSAREAYQMSLSPQVTVHDLSRVLEQDPGLAMRLLRQANDSLVSPVSPCRSIHEAIHRAGITPVRHLLMRATSERLLVIPEDRGMTEQLQGRAPAVARCARRIARRIGADANVAFTAGLLHDIGWVLAFDMLRNHPQHFPDWVHTERSLTWRRIAEYSHQLLGATLARSWGMPSPVVAAIAFHHEPKRAREPEAEMAYIVSVANTLCDYLDLFPDRGAAPQQDWSAAWAIGVDPEGLQRDAKAMGRSIQQQASGMAVGVVRPHVGQGHKGRGLGSLDDGLEDSR